MRTADTPPDGEGSTAAVPGAACRSRRLHREAGSHGQGERMWVGVSSNKDNKARALAAAAVRKEPDLSSLDRRRRCCWE